MGGEPMEPNRWIGHAVTRSPLAGLKGLYPGIAEHLHRPDNPYVDLGIESPTELPKLFDGPAARTVKAVLVKVADRLLGSHHSN